MGEINSYIRNFLDTPECDGIDTHDKLGIIALWESEETQQTLLKILENGEGLGKSKPPEEFIKINGGKTPDERLRDDFALVHVGTPALAELDFPQSDAGTAPCKSTNNSHEDENTISQESNIPEHLHVDTSTSKIKKGKEQKRAKNAYILFSQDHRALVKNGLPHDCKSTDVIRELGKQWKSLTSSTDRVSVELVEKYTNLAAEEKKNFASKTKQNTHGGKKHKVTSQYCYGCYNDGLGYCDNEGWFYCHGCWDVWAVGGLSKATSLEAHNTTTAQPSSETPHSKDFAGQNITEQQEDHPNSITNKSTIHCNLDQNDFQDCKSAHLNMEIGHLYGSDMEDAHSVY